MRIPNQIFSFFSASQSGVSPEGLAFSGVMRALGSKKCQRNYQKSSRTKSFSLSGRTKPKWLQLDVPDPVMTHRGVVVESCISFRPIDRLCPSFSCCKQGIAYYNPLPLYWLLSCSFACQI